MKKSSLRHRFHTLLFLFVVTTQTLQASWQIPIVHYTPEQYAAGTQNWQLAEQQNGWVYAANNHGLLEFDGNNWELYGIWNSTTIRSVLVGTDDAIYVGATNDFGVFRPDVRGGLTYQPLTLEMDDRELHFGEIWSITQIDDVLFFQAKHNIFKVQADGDVQTITSSARIYTCATLGGALFVATSEGLAVLSGAKLVVLHGSELLRGSEIRKLAQLDEERLLIATDFNGLFILEDNTIRPWKTEADAFMHRNQLYTCAVQGNRIAVGTVMNGVVLLDEQGRVVSTISHRDGLQNNTVLSLMFDHAGNLWAGLDQGVDCILLESTRRFLDGGETVYGTGYAAAYYKGDLYLGTNQGLYRLPKFRLENPALCEGKLELVSGSLGQVWSLAEVNGELLCCHNRGLFRVMGNRFIKVCEDDGFWRIRQLDENTWIAGTYRGFYLLDGKNVTRLQGVDDTALQFEIDATGVIWLCTLRGLQRIEINESRTQLRSEVLYHDPIPHKYVNIARVKDSVFIASTDFVLKVSEDGSWNSDYAWSLLHGSQLYQFVEVDQDGCIWYTVNDAVYVVRENGERLQVLDKHIFVGGFANVLCLGNGYAVIGGKDGFYLLDASKVTDKSSCAQNNKLYVRKMRTILPEERIICGESYVTNDTSVVLDPADYSLAFEFGGVFTYDETARFATYLEPKEKTYGPLTEDNYKEYSMLSAGHYTLHVRALVGEEEYETSLSFRIRPPWYHTTLAYLLYVLLGLLLLVCIIWRIIVGVNESKRRFEQEKLEELRESKMKILELENEKNQIDLQSKSQELSNLLLNQINKNELATEVLGDLRRITDELDHKNIPDALKRLRWLQERLVKNTENDKDWKRFEENYDVVNASFLKNLSRQFPWMTKNEKKLCVYIRMGLLTKEIAPLMGLTTRGVEMLRYRMRQKMELEPQVNLKEYFDKMHE